MEVEAAGVAVDHAGDIIRAVVNIGNQLAGERRIVVRVSRGESPCVFLAILKHSREGQIPCDGTGRANRADSQLGVSKGLAARLDLGVGGRAGRGRLGDGEGRSLVTVAACIGVGRSDGVCADGQREASCVERCTGRYIGGVGIAHAAGVTCNGCLFVLDAGAGVDSGAGFKDDAVGDVGLVIGLDLQIIGAGFVVAGDRRDSHVESCFAGSAVQLVGDHVFAIDHSGLLREDRVAASGGECDGEASLRLVGEEEVGRERAGLHLSLGAEARDGVDAQVQVSLCNSEGRVRRAGEVALTGDGDGGSTSVDVGGVRNGVILICLKRSAADRNGHFRSMCLGVIGHVSDRRERAAGNFRRIDSEGLFRRAREVIAYTGDDDLRSTGVDVVLIGNRVVGISC